MEIEGINSNSSNTVAKVSYDKAIDLSSTSATDSSDGNDVANSLELSLLSKKMFEIEASFLDNSSAKNGVIKVGKTTSDKDNPLTLEYLSKFVTTAEDVKTLDTSAFQKIFELIDKMKDMGLDISKWMKMFTSLGDFNLQQSFVESTSTIMNQDMDSDDIKDSMDNFLSKVDSVLENNSSKDSTKSVSLSSYFTNIVYNQPTLTSKQVTDVVNEAMNKKYGISFT